MYQFIKVQDHQIFTIILYNSARSFDQIDDKLYVKDHKLPLRVDEVQYNFILYNIE